MSINILPVTVIESRMITPKVKHFVLRCDDLATCNYLPGQFITIHFENEGTALKRSYSIANAPGKDNRIEFAAGYFANGPGTQFLFNLKPGDTINISGPFGRLIFREEIPKRYIMVATSTGVTPYRAMLSELSIRMKKHPDLEVIILLGVQKREEILYSQEFKDFIAQHPKAIFRAHLSRELPNTLQHHEYTGYVQHAFPELNLNPSEDVVYLCGNPGMIDDAFNYLKEQGFTTQQVIREKYISR